ncbi:MAG: hypothetical protein Q8M29_00785 [Bacteroidota bacterium]|nr:hypothetical protein [Bacteroidota bacterium]
MDALSMQEALNLTVLWVVIVSGDQVKHAGVAWEQQVKVRTQRTDIEIITK